MGGGIGGVGFRSCEVGGGWWGLGGLGVGGGGVGLGFLGGEGWPGGLQQRNLSEVF